VNVDERGPLEGLEAGSDVLSKLAAAFEQVEFAPLNQEGEVWTSVTGWVPVRELLKHLPPKRITPPVGDR